MGAWELSSAACEFSGYWVTHPATEISVASQVFFWPAAVASLGLETSFTDLVALLLPNPRSRWILLFLYNCTWLQLNYLSNKINLYEHI